MQSCFFTFTSICIDYCQFIPFIVGLREYISFCHPLALKANINQQTTKSLLETILNILLVMSQGCGLVDQWYLVGLSLYRKKLYEEAIKCFDRSLELSSLRGFNSWYMKGNSLYQMNEFKEAIKCFDNSMS
jgi:tetratricopeptide (TPR) repeat protein